MQKLLPLIITSIVVYCVDVPIKINFMVPAAVVDQKFLSLTIGSSIVKEKFKNIDLTSKKLITLARGLTLQGKKAEVFIRIGGTIADHVIFDPNMYILNATELNLLCKFAHNLGWELIYDLNVLLRKGDGSWNPSNAIEFIDYVESKNITLHYELGNEPDLFPTHLNFTIAPKQLATDFETLRVILNEKTGRQSLLVGPDVATLSRYNYFANVLSNITQHVLDAVTFHHYYSSSEHVTVYNFTDVNYLDSFLTYGLKALSIIKASFTSFPPPPAWLGETSSTYGGGSEDIGQSFSAGFLWLDKLGLAAQMNISVVMRQTLMGGHYSLLDKNYFPNPDYWTSLLHKQLMGTKVLDVTGYLQYNRKVRVYAHCVNQYGRHGYHPLSLVLMVLNLNPSEQANIQFAMGGWEGLIADLYLFQPAYGSLSDRYVTLNGKLLKMVDDITLPELRPVYVAQPYIIPSLSYGFLVIVNSTVPACIE